MANGWLQLARVRQEASRRRVVRGPIFDLDKLRAGGIQHARRCRETPARWGVSASSAAPFVARGRAVRDAFSTPIGGAVRALDFAMRLLHDGYAALRWRSASDAGLTFACWR